jgi:hypothetical protein
MAIILPGGYSIKYPKGQTPLHVPHCRQVRKCSPSGTSHKLEKNISLKERREDEVSVANVVMNDLLMNAIHP